MRVDAAAFAKRLNAPLQGTYLLFGHEPLLIEESCDAIRRAALAQGFDERLRFSADRSFDWEQLVDQTRSLPLFASRRMLEVRLPSGRPGDTGGRVLGELAGSPPADTLVVIIAGRLDASARNAKWCKAIERHGTLVEHAAVTPERLPGWIRQRLRAERLDVEKGVVEHLSHLLEGNLLAAAQEIRLLALLAPKQRIRVKDVETIIADNARFDVYKFVDACLAGNLARALRILFGLRREGAEPSLVLWALAREARSLASMAAALDAGSAVAQVLRSHRVWQSRSGLVGGALRRLARPQCLALMQQLARADRVLKGRESVTMGEGVWTELERIAATLCGVDAPPKPAEVRP